MDDSDNQSMTRRGVMKGVGGLAALSMSNATVATAKDVLERPLASDPHTRETYRSIVDAIVPRTPELEDELGPEHVPGGLDVELEKFLIWDFNHFQEVRLETLTENKEATNLTGMLDGSSPDGPAETMPVEMFEVEFDLTDAATDLDGLADSFGVDLLDLDLGLDAAVDDIREHLSFGGVERFSLTVADDLSTDPEGPASFDLLVETPDGTFDTTQEDYLYANVFPFAFDILAAEFLAQGRNADQPQPREQFAGGGTFVTLSRQDRLRCIWDIVEEGSIDQLDSLLSPMMPAVGILKFVVMAVNGLHGFGYYTEWSGLGSTKTDEPADRQMEVDASRVQSRQQTKYPGPADGYAADWRHVLPPKGFDDGKYKIDNPNQDPFEVDLDLGDDLAGDDVAPGIGGDT